MEIERIDSYVDDRFSKKALLQHGAYLIDDEPYEIVIVSDNKAIVYGNKPEKYEALIEQFRYHAPHITNFVDEKGKAITNISEVEVVDIALDLIQPSQFFVDEQKLEAVSSFINKPEDVIVQVVPWEDRYISMDGHTRLFYACQNGFKSVKAVVVEMEDWVWTFVEEARNRKIHTPYDLKLLTHEEYEVQWNQYCDSIFN